MEKQSKAAEYQKPGGDPKKHHREMTDCFEEQQSDISTATMEAR